MFNNLLKDVKENNSVQNFIKDLSNYLEEVKRNEKMEEILKQEECLYQVVELAEDGVYLQNTMNNKISKEKDINKDLLSKITNDSILRYQNGKYIYEEEITRKVFRESNRYKRIYKNKKRIYRNKWYIRK
mgnify:FL=1